MQRFPFGSRCRPGAETLDQLLDRHLVALADLLEDFGCRRLEFLDLQTAQKPNVINHPLVAWRSGGDVDGAIPQSERQDAVKFDEIDGKEADRLRRDRDPAQAGQRALRAHLLASFT